MPRRDFFSWDAKATKLSPTATWLRSTGELSDKNMKASNSNPLVSIVLPCRNEQGYIQACLPSALAQAPPEGGFEIIVADGMSTDGTREYLQHMAKEHPQIRFLDNPGRIVSTGLNAAIRAARGQIILRMDAHTVYA